MTMSEQAEQEVARHERQTLAGSYLERALVELRASGSSDSLYPITHAGVRVSPPMRGALGKRIARGRREESTRSAVLFAMLAAEAYANQYLQIHLTGEEFSAAHSSIPSWRLRAATGLATPRWTPLNSLSPLLTQQDA